MDRVFRRVNGCQSAVGEQVLYWQLHRLEPMPQWERLLSHLQANLRSGKNCGFCWPGWGNGAALWAAEFLFCPVEVSLSLGALYPLFALLPLAGFCCSPGTCGQAAASSSALWVELGALLSGQKPHPRGFRTPALFFRPAVGGGRTGQNLQFSPVQQKLRQASQAFHGMKGRLAVLGPRGSSELELLQEYFHILTLRIYACTARRWRLSRPTPKSCAFSLRRLGWWTPLSPPCHSVPRCLLGAPLRFRQATHWNVPAYSTRCSTNLWQTVENWKRMCCLPAPTPREIHLSQGIGGKRHLGAKPSSPAPRKGTVSPKGWSSPLWRCGMTSQRGKATLWRKSAP